MQTTTPPAAMSPQDERIMASISHAAIILPMWGLIAPVLIWMTQREKSRFVAFQALQAAIFHFIMVVAWFAAGACYMSTFFLIFAGAFTISSARDSVAPVIGTLFLLPFLLVLLILLFSLVAVVLGIIAAVRTFQGHDFRYPLVAGWADRYLQNNP